ncbi:LPXTG cell wall anchor domain-containing protein [Staphylococcus epidermidis]|uniref:LPXTG cell wall anchor domain-containing protein n=1 Tax=Staphylococcus epidermidis TaxID=1282 RepID=UPI000F89BAD7|nr:LPXTG cell wall anchor domain-containing protein [Staphylococcus epidermidis]KAB2278913.1 LPXTG cell wall anchor domain-containing protein [Staphylococcus epidermidis]MBM0798056.1 LPXTG cell wall anchor domain-containing protein [Staphylococcus epidermidis]MBM0837179.1 LPXTG cell wall anchor domain-containing protein [Staphylococcus epidermidis]MCG1335207.1 LPXTG cell wall anchor domain-containing protein [Staphylococcus epidermidis]MCG1528272.1 LPXTG cell wall anchor domain-containing prot
MKDNKPNNSKLIQTYLSKKTLRYGTASALTLAFYLFNSNVTVYADENTANQNQGTSPKTSQTAPTNNNENTDATAVTTDQNNNDEEEYDASYELPILYVTVWLDDQGNIIKDAVEDAKTPASERQPVKIPGYQHYRTSMSDGITKFIYRKISTAQSSIVENNQQDNNTNKVVETTNQNKDEVNGKEQNQANTSVTNTQITKNEKDEDTKTLQKDKDEKESKDAKTPKKDKKEKITKTPKKDREEKKPVIPNNGKVGKDEDTKTPKKDKKTPKKDREEKKPVIPSNGKVEKDEDTKITKKDKEDEITTTSKKDNNNDVQDKLPETGKTNDFQNPALIMLLAGLGLLGLFRNKIRE